jgi:tRNA U34 5-carboxymethylaminomethyl modifying GTPase MnmE/TrmE
MLYNDSIVALATPSGAGAIAVISEYQALKQLPLETVCLNP